MCSSLPGVFRNVYNILFYLFWLLYQLLLNFITHWHLAVGINFLDVLYRILVSLSSMLPYAIYISFFFCHLHFCSQYHFIVLSLSLQTSLFEKCFCCGLEFLTAQSLWHFATQSLLWPNCSPWSGRITKLISFPLPPLRHLAVPRCSVLGTTSVPLKLCLALGFCDPGPHLPRFRSSVTVLSLAALSSPAF